jgi:hypothetical protein
VEDIIVGRYDRDPQAQGVIRPKSGKWQLVIDNEGYPHLFVESNLEGTNGETLKGMFCLEDLLPEGLKVKDIMNSTFRGALSPEKEEEVVREYLTSRMATGIPCPREV